MRALRSQHSDGLDKTQQDEVTLAKLLDPAERSRKPKTTRLRSLNTNWWSYEILSIVVSLYCSVALVALLWTYHGQSVPIWHHRITLNAAISILATAAKGSLMLAVAEALGQTKWLWFWHSEHKLEDFQTFDAASRGPWGALTFLAKMKIRGVASFGAFVTVLALTFDPFIQQVVVYPLRPLTTANVTIARAQNLSSDMVANSSSTGLSAAFYNALFNGDKVSSFTPICPTGNCTWPLVTSLALCSNCENVPKNSAMNCTRDHNDGEYNNYFANLTCNYTISRLPHGFSLYYYSSEGDPNNPPLQVLQVSSVNGYPAGEPSNFTFAGTQNPWAGFARVMLDRGAPLNVTNVTLCAFHPCVKTYNVSVSQGVLISQEFRTWDVTETVVENFDNEGYGDQILTLPDDSLNDSTTQTDFYIDPLTASHIADFLSNEMNGTFAYGVNGGSNSAVLQVLYSTNDLGYLMDTVATSLSSYMRNFSSEVVIGQASTMQNYVHVRWIWLILPIALAPASSVFLAIVMWRSRAESVRIWKSSELASMFHGLNDHSLQTTDRLDRQTDMEDLSKRMFVRLQRADDDVYRLVRRGSPAELINEEMSTVVATGREPQDASRVVHPSVIQPPGYVEMRHTKDTVTTSDEAGQTTDSLQTQRIGEPSSDRVGNNASPDHLM